MSEIPWFISSAILVLMWAIQTVLYLREQRKNQHLVNQLLESSGHEPIPEDAPIGKMLKEFGASPVGEEQVKKVKKAQERIRFNIPGMERFNDATKRER